ncbi:unnamed protein product [Urochloa decumbens]|uniref:AAA+ ATPase domain-containing protein n=1 Tax=Urochloa decumbens TaxID=240449 RepID=A0ABC9B0Y1_9POAL
MEIAVSAARWVVGKALAPVMDGLLEAWAASAGLGPNIDSLKMELLYVQAMLDNSRGREIRSPALQELLHKLRQLAYGAEDVLDYFRIQDELQGTYETTGDDVDARCAIRDLRHAAKAVAKQLVGLCSCGSRPPAASLTSDDDDDDDGEPGQPEATCCVCAACWKMARRNASLSHTVRNAGKLFPFPSFLPAESSGMTDPITPAPRLEFDRVEMSKRMKAIVDELKPLCKMVSTILNLDLLDSNRSIAQDIAANLLTERGRTPLLPPKNIAKSRSITTSDIMEPNFFGREIETNKVIDVITIGDDCCVNDLTVIPIVGLGGMGKTTLARHIYKKVEKYFDVKIWVCVSVNFSVTRLTREIAESIQSEKSGNPENLIEQGLKSKRFLLVLDDMWNCGDRDEWNRLLAPLRKAQTKGSIILVTTRSPALSQLVKTTDAVELEGLDDASFWNLFISYVFDNDESKNELLLEIGRKIVKKLKGSPLAAKTVGRLLRNHLDTNHWERVLHSKEWELQTGDHDIIPALKLSYDYLPFHLQQCFSYCCLFPEDYGFSRWELVQLWIGLDILPSYGHGKNNEDIGKNCLNDLVDHGFFKEDKIYGRPRYTIHDLLRDLGLNTASRECLSIDHANVGSVEIWPSVRHLSIIIDGADGSDGIITDENFLRELRVLKKKLKVEKLQTLMIFGKLDEFFNSFLRWLILKANGLRVLHLSEMIPHMEFSALHLRYLRLGRINTREMHLPSMLSRLYLLRILYLQQEWKQSLSLPRDTSNLIKLHHLFTMNDVDHSQICNVGKMNMLQELKRFEVNKEGNGFELKQLGNLAELRVLGIYNLEKVHTKEEATQAQLINKIYLHSLTLDWHAEAPINERDMDGEIIERLKPCRNLKILRIRGHGSHYCPTWLGCKLSVKALEYVHLDGVDWKDRPWLGHMSMLHSLTLQNMSTLKEFSPAHLGSMSEQNFRNLTRLELIELQGLEKWDLGNTLHSFSQLENLIIRKCPQLSSLPFVDDICYPPMPNEDGKRHSWFPNMQWLEVENCPKVVSLPPVPWTKTLRFVKIKDVGSPLLHSLKYSKLFSDKELEIAGNQELQTLDEVLVFSNLADLRNLCIRDCPPLEVKHLQMLILLKKLEVKSHHVFVQLESEGKVDSHFPVEVLGIDSEHTTGKELSQLLSHFPKLSSLQICCNKIKWLGVHVDQEKTPLPLDPSSSSWTFDRVCRWIKDKVGYSQETTHGQQQLASAVEQKETDIQDGLLLLPAHLSDCLRSLIIYSMCPELMLVVPPFLLDSQDASTSEPEIRFGGEGVGLGPGLRALCCLQELIIHSCSKFLSAYNTSSPASFHHFPSSLQYLNLMDVGPMGTLEPLSNLISLTELLISDCGEDFRGMGLWTLIAHGQLTKLSVFGCPKFFVCSDLMRGLKDEQDQEQLLHRSLKLRELDTDDVAGVLAVPICTLLSSFLTNLALHGDKEMKRYFTKEQEKALMCLSSLQKLRFLSFKKLQCLPAGLHTLGSLKILCIRVCPVLSSLPKDGLPSSLQELDVNCTRNKELIKQCKNFVRNRPQIKLIL